MLNEQAIALEARLIAIEHVLAHVAKTAYLAIGAPESVIALAHGNIRQAIRDETFPNAPADPVLKDHFAAVIFENVDRLLADFERALRDARAPGTPQ